MRTSAANFLRTARRQAKGRAPVSAAGAQLRTSRLVGVAAEERVYSPATKRQSG